MQIKSNKETFSTENILNLNKIKKFMSDNKLTHKQFSKLCGISVATLFKILNAQSNIRIVSLYKIADGMNIKLKELFLKSQPLL